MSVYTIIEENELNDFLSNYDVGELTDFRGISDGISNTNYFVDTDRGRYVLTIFEQHDFEEMQYFLNLMHHLAEHQVPSADPVANRQGHYLSLFKGKPIALVERLKGSNITETTINHCEQLGVAMGKMHTAGLSFDERQENPRGPAWCQHTAQKVIDKLNDDELEGVIAHEGAIVVRTGSHTSAVLSTSITPVTMCCCMTWRSPPMTGASMKTSA